MKTTASMFTGGALFDVGAVQAGYEPIWGIEWDDKIASIARLNGFPVQTGDVNNMLPQGKNKMHLFDPDSGESKKLHRPDHLHASPPCPNFSVAKAGGKETEFDIAMAESVARAIVHFNPDTFTLENVPAYYWSQSFQIIVNTLHQQGYFTDFQNLNAANFGVPQTRNRLWIRASKRLMMPYPEPVKWRGWYQAIEDLTPSLPDAEFAPWQIARLPKEYKTFLIGQGTYFASIEPDQPAQTITGNNNQSAIKALIVESKFPGRNGSVLRDGMAVTGTVTAIDPNWKAFIMSSGNNSFADARAGFGVRCPSEPVHTMMAGKTETKIKAFVLDGQANGNGKSMTVRDGENPIFTVTSSAEKRPTRAYVGRVVKMTVKALGRFQTVPDDYQGLTVRINGNGVPCQLAKAVLETL